LIAQPTAITTNHRGDYLFGYSLPTTIPSNLLHDPRNLIIVKLILSPILFIAGIHFPPILLHNQGYPKVCPDPLNLPNAGDPFAGTSSSSFYSLFSPTRDLIASI
jgi:energy-converting hydrogenase Eha subunit F